MAVVVLLAAGCTPAPAPPETSAPSTSLPAETVRTVTPPPIPAPPPPAVHPVTADELGGSWRPGCPVEPDALRRVELDYVGLDGQVHRGELIVNQDVVTEVQELFAELRALRFPIDKMRNVAQYPNAEDELSMRDNNTSAFNCRGIPGSDSWSYHAYGRAIDVNPLWNPYVNSRGEFEPATAGPYLDRSRTDPGMMHAGDPAVRVFTDRGWTWGGDWRSPKDYQHFERP